MTHDDTAATRQCRETVSTLMSASIDPPELGGACHGHRSRPLPAASRDLAYLQLIANVRCDAVYAVRCGTRDRHGEVSPWNDLCDSPPGGGW